MTLTLKLDLVMVKMYFYAENELPYCSNSKVTVTGRHTDRPDWNYYLSATRGWQKCSLCYALHWLAFSVHLGFLILLHCDLDLAPDFSMSFFQSGAVTLIRYFFLLLLNYPCFYFLYSLSLRKNMLSETLGNRYQTNTQLFCLEMSFIQCGADVLRYTSNKIVVRPVKNICKKKVFCSVNAHVELRCSYCRVFYWDQGIIPESALSPGNLLSFH